MSRNRCWLDWKYLFLHQLARLGLAMLANIIIRAIMTTPALHLLASEVPNRAIGFVPLYLHPRPHGAACAQPPRTGNPGVAGENPQR